MPPRLFSASRSSAPGGNRTHTTPFRRRLSGPSARALIWEAAWAWGVVPGAAWPAPDGGLSPLACSGRGADGPARPYLPQGHRRSIRALVGRVVPPEPGVMQIAQQDPGRLPGEVQRAGGPERSLLLGVEGALRVWFREGCQLVRRAIEMLKQQGPEAHTHVRAIHRSNDKGGSVDRRSVGPDLNRLPQRIRPGCPLWAPIV